MSQLEIKNLTLAYDGQAVVENLNFSVNKGDYLCIVGDNGSGKTTLIKSIAGLIKHLSGSIEFENKSDRRHLGYLPQQTQIQKDFPASVFEVVLSGCVSSLGLSPFYTAKHRKKVIEKLQLLEIEDLKNKCYRELSGGQQQRVLLARALCATDSLLLLDEPTTGLDPKATAEMYEIIKDLNEKGLTVIMVSHDVEQAVKYADTILHLSHFSHFFGTKEEYLVTPVWAAFSGGAK